MSLTRVGPSQTSLKDTKTENPPTDTRAGFLVQAKSEIQPLYRGDARDFKEIFNNGFKSHGSNKDLVSHITNDSYRHNDRAYISTSLSKQIAVKFPDPRETEATYLYEVHSKRPTINVGNKLARHAFRYPHLLREHERAFFKEILASEIKGGWYVSHPFTMEPPVLQKGFYHNPNYIPQEYSEHKLFRAGRVAGCGLTGLGLGLDGIRLHHEYEISNQSGDYRNTYLEGARIAGGWAGAWAMGAMYAEAGLALGAPLNPIGTAVCGIAGGLIGSAIGYFVGSDIANSAATQIYDVNRSNFSILDGFKNFSIINGAHAEEMPQLQVYEEKNMLRQDTQFAIKKVDTRVNNEADLATTHADEKTKSTQLDGTKPKLNSVKKRDEKVDEKLNQERKAVADVKNEAGQLVIIFQEIHHEHKSEEPFSIGPKFSKAVQNFGQKLEYAGRIGEQASQLAVKLGAHARTGKDLEFRAKGAIMVGQGLVMGGPLGTLMVANGLIDMITGFQSNSEFEEIKKALEEIKNILIAGFNHLSKLISENMALVLTQLKKITDDLARIENVLAISFSELHQMDLIKATYEIQEDIKGEGIPLKDWQRDDHLRNLARWMEVHSKSKLQTSLLRDSKDSSRCLEILTSEDFDIETMFPFFIMQLANLLPKNMIPGINALPNVALLAKICDTFILAINHYKLPGNYTKLLKRVMDQFNEIKNLISDLKENKEIWEILFRQYNYYRYQVGRAIRKCLNEISAPYDEELLNKLKPGINKDNLIEILDRLEIRRVILVMLFELTGKQEYFQSIRNLESKAQILSRLVDVYRKDASQLITHAHKGDHVNFVKSLEYGADINGWDSPNRLEQWGQAIHYIPYHRNKFYSLAPRILHELFKSGDELKYMEGTRKILGDTWGRFIIPIKYILNGAHLDLALLYCANGYDIPISTDYFENGIGWAVNTNWSYYVQLHMVKEFNSADGILAKKPLRKAYQFYKQIEAGFCPPTEGINHDCLLWIVCVLGDLKALLAFKELKKEIFNRQLPISGFTPLMMATNCGHENVVDYLLKNGADVRVNGNFVIKNERYHSIYIAKLRGSWHIARKLLADIDVQLSFEPFEAWYKAFREARDKENALVSIAAKDEKRIVVEVAPSKISLLAERCMKALEGVIQILEAGRVNADEKYRDQPRLPASTALAALGLHAQRPHDTAVASASAVPNAGYRPAGTLQSK